MQTSQGLRCSQARGLGVESRVYRATAVCRHPEVCSSSRARLGHRHQVARTDTATQETQATAQASWSPWGFFGKRKEQQLEQQLSTVSEAELWQLLEAEQTVPLVVIFSATWCGPCKIMVQRLEGLMKQLGPQGLKAVKIDTDECPELASQLKVHKLPTMFFIGPNPSKPAAHYTGLLPEAVIRDMVTERRKFLGTDIRNALSV